MKAWLGLLAAPALALACQTALYALVTPSCEAQNTAALHAVSGLSLALTLMFAWMAWSGRHGGPRQGEAEIAASAGSRDARAVLAVAGAAVAVLSALTVVAMWVGVWLLSPCW